MISAEAGVAAEAGEIDKADNAEMTGASTTDMTTGPDVS